MSPDLGYLADMLESARLALEHTAGLTEEEFATDVKTQDSVIRRLEVIGEAASKISSITRQELPTIPWSEVIGQRHVAIHHYRKLVMSRIWATIHEDLPTLIEDLQRFLEKQQ
jgi:uncharacterized protein with HEPN domain